MQFKQTGDLPHSLWWCNQSQLVYVLRPQGTVYILRQIAIPAPGNQAEDDTAILSSIRQCSYFTNLWYKSFTVYDAIIYPISIHMRVALFSFMFTLPRELVWITYPYTSRLMHKHWHRCVIGQSHKSYNIRLPYPTVHNSDVHISVLNGALLVMKQVHRGMC